MASWIIFCSLSLIVVTPSESSEFVHSKGLVISDSADGSYGVHYVPSYRSSHREDGQPGKSHQFVASVPLIVKATKTRRPPILVPTSHDKINMFVIDCKTPPCNNIISVNTPAVSPHSSSNVYHPSTLSPNAPEKNSYSSHLSGFSTFHTGLRDKTTKKWSSGSTATYDNKWITKRPLVKGHNGDSFNFAYHNPPHQFSDAVRRPTYYNYDHSFSYEPKGGLAKDFVVMTHQHSWHGDKTAQTDRFHRPHSFSGTNWGSKPHNSYNSVNVKGDYQDRWGSSGDGSFPSWDVTKRPSVAWAHYNTISQQPERPWKNPVTTFQTNSATNVSQ